MKPTDRAYRRQMQDKKVVEPQILTAPAVVNAPTEKKPFVKNPLQILGYKKGIKRCGHEADFKILKGEKPENEARRREKWNGKLCEACIADNVKKAQANSKSAKRRAIIGDWKTSATRNRLPNGSEFHAIYSHITVEWKGTMRIPSEEGILTFETTGHSIRMLCGKLDFLYREKLKQAEKPTEIALEKNE